MSAPASCTGWSRDEGTRRVRLLGAQPEKQVLAGERAVFERSLLAAGLSQNVVPHPAEELAELEARLGQILDQRFGVRAVVARLAVDRHLAVAGGVGDEDIGMRGLDPSKPALAK